MEPSFVVYNLRIVLQRDLFWQLVYQNDDDGNNNNSSNVTYVEKHRIVLKSFSSKKFQRVPVHCMYCTVYAIHIFSTTVCHAFFGWDEKTVRESIFFLSSQQDSRRGRIKTKAENMTCGSYRGIQCPISLKFASRIQALFVSSNRFGFGFKYKFGIHIQVKCAKKGILHASQFGISTEFVLTFG